LTVKLSGGTPPKEELVEIMTVTKETSVSKADQIKLNFSTIPSKTSTRALYPWLTVKCPCGERVGSCFSCTHPASEVRSSPSESKTYTSTVTTIRSTQTQTPNRP
jgi:hypothetical protein